ncbi:hypothetical protein [Pseudoalteromonas sp. '520P1 No. 423']|uniref:hypothetical protein n=1 Tax=Pseudoalteromonas sp. '520P1 No. 423' TaxID=1690037 RepID=UPI000750D37B|nr:hypothetical protein [Pseudoalteromonas sp. '520P1 No. 423']
MQKLNENEIQSVTGGVTQGEAIGGNMSIVAIGVGIAVAGSAPAWFPIMMIGVSVSLTASYLSGSGSTKKFRGPIVNN